MLLLTHTRGAFRYTPIGAVLLSQSWACAKASTPVLAQESPGTLAVSALIERIGPPSAAPRELATDLLVAGVAVRVARPCPPCKGPTPCRPCWPEVHDFADEPGGATVPVSRAQGAVPLEQGRRYVLQGRILPGESDPSLSVKWYFEPSKVYKLVPPQ